MYVVAESEIANLLTPEMAFVAVETVFASMARHKAYNFPVVREAIGYEEALFGFKGGFDAENPTLGLKAGGYWPNNQVRGLINHQSTVLLFDPSSGRIAAAVGGNLLTALRTAAASAVSIKYLAPKESKILGVIGAGHQSAFQVRAAMKVHPFEKIVGWNPHPEMLTRLETTAYELNVPFESVGLDRLGAESDVIITITSSFGPLLMSDHVKGPTHIAAMGTDTRGKQELDPTLLSRARIFTDEVRQSTSIGECQHAVALGLVREQEIVELGAVVNGAVPGRIAREISVYDGTGIGLQDLAVAALVVKLAKSAGVAQLVQL